MPPTTDKDAFVRETERQLRLCRDRIEAMQREIEERAAEEAWMRRVVDKLSRRRDELERRVRSAPEQADERWEEVRDDLEHAVHDIRDSVARTFEAVAR